MRASRALIKSQRVSWTDDFTDSTNLLEFRHGRHEAVRSSRKDRMSPRDGFKDTSTEGETDDDDNRVLMRPIPHA
jgi:hypothetical protein